MKAKPVLQKEKEVEAVLDCLKFGEDGLIPAVVQDVKTGEVLMVAYMNRESLKRSLQTGRTCFYSRSRQRLWLKGETSGNYQYIQEVRWDCDGDALLLRVEQVGFACHDGYRSCFYLSAVPTAQAGRFLVEPLKRAPDHVRIIDELYEVIKERQMTLPEGSYTAKLFRKGIDKIVKKLGEEVVEVAIAGINRNKDEVIEETADLVYHLLVLLAACGVSPGEVYAKLAERRR